MQVTITAPAAGLRIGDILVRQGLLTAAEVQQVLAVQRKQGRPFGDLAERLFGVCPQAVEQAWVAQYADLAAVTDPQTVEVDPECAALLNRRQAWQFHLLPAVRENGELVLLTDAAHLPKALRFAAATFDEATFIRVLATDDLLDLLREYHPVPEFLERLATKR